MKPTLPFLPSMRAWLLACGWFFSSCVFAWGGEGHQVVAALAQTQLSAPTQAYVHRLLSLEPGATMVSLSTWADEHRMPVTSPWHYVNFPRNSCIYDAKRDCPNGQCVVAAIDQQLSILASKASDERKLKALAYLIHFVADVHQPLHAGYLDDKGGNAYQLQAFMRGSNLHALWDTGLIKHLNQDTASLALSLAHTPLDAIADDLNAAHAAQESCRIVGSPGFYPQRRVGSEYIDKFTPVAKQRLALAAARLARMLNQTLR